MARRKFKDVNIVLLETDDKSELPDIENYYLRNHYVPEMELRLPLWQR